MDGRHKSQLEPEDLLLLYSDGLCACVPQEQLLQNLTHAASDLDTLAETLLQQALKADGPDNISIVLVRFSRRNGWPSLIYQ